MNIPDNFAQKELIGELVTLVRSHKLTRAGLPEWELHVKFGDIPLKLRVFQELNYALELVGVELTETPNGSNWENNPLYYGVLGYDEKHNRLTLSAIKTPTGKHPLDLQAFTNRQSNRNPKLAPEMPVLARKEAPKPIAILPATNLSLAEKAALIAKLAAEIESELAADGFKQHLAAMIIYNANMLTGQEPPKWVKPVKKGRA